MDLDDYAQKEKLDKDNHIDMDSNVVCQQEQRICPKGEKR
jgi:hypothetical protein